MPPILHQAPAWASPTSEYFILWHGCTAWDKNNIEKAGINPLLGKVDTDFGRGFYTTTLERQAKQWAWDRYYDWQAKNPTHTGNQPVVLRFRVRRYGINPRRSAQDDGMDELRSLHFVLGNYDYEDYWSLVQHCRASTPASINDHGHPSGGWYDVVSGPVAAFWRQRVAMADSDQFSFHTTRAVALLNSRLRNGMAGDKDDYRWDPVI
jgi:hypothetical protein